MSEGISRRQAIFGGLALLLGSCSNMLIGRPSATRTVESVVEESLGYLSERKFDRAIELLERYAIREQPSEHCLLAFAYAKSNRFNDAESEFRWLINKFETSPMIVETVRGELKDFFPTSLYRESMKELAFFSTFLPDLDVPRFFIYLCEGNNDEAARLLKYIMPRHEGKVAPYIGHFDKLFTETKKPEYERIREILNGYKLEMDARKK